MRRMRGILSEEGFTLHEILVAIVVSSLVMGFGLSLFTFAHKYLAAREKLSDLKGSVDRTLFVLSTDIEQSCRLEVLSDTSIVVREPRGRLVAYRFDGTKILRNGTAMHDESLQIKVSIKELQNSSSAVARLRALQVRLIGEQGGGRHEAETVALVPWSADQEFTKPHIR